MRLLLCTRRHKSAYVMVDQSTRIKYLVWFGLSGDWYLLIVDQRYANGWGRGGRWVHDMVGVNQRDPFKEE